jgi:prepilin-type N-terminal cleavage/methylation domain-containing protein
MKQYRTKTDQSGAGAFTLIELLVVIAIIAILASMLLSSLSRAKNQAWRVTCLNNIKQVMLAESLYISDNNDYPPWPNWAGGPNADGKGWAYDPANYQLVRQVQGGLLWPYAQNAQVFVCPVDMATTNSLGTPPETIYSYQELFQQRYIKFISYICNGAIINWPAGLTTLRASRFKASNDLFWEADERDPFFFNDGASPPSQGLTTRHENGGTVAAFDDHAEWMTYVHYYSLVGDAPFPPPTPGPRIHWIQLPPNDFWCDPQVPDGGYGDGY